MIEAGSVSLIGLPTTGKSTYLGALWLLLQDPNVGDLSEEDTSGDRSYLDKLAEQVAAGQVIQRTDVDSDQGLSMKIRFDKSATIDLEIPDLSGEAVRQLVEERLWRKVFATAVSKSHGFILFVHPDKIQQAVPANFGQQPIPSAANQQQKPEFSAESACTAAKLVELLENLVELRWDSWPLRLAVVISAWDRAAPNLSPAQWLKTRLPGVDSFLETNPDVVSSSVFGVSAQGGQLPDQKDELLAKGDVSNRAFAAAFDGTPTSPYAPLRWVISADA